MELAEITLKAPEGAAWDFLVLFLVVIVGPPLVRRARIPGLIGLLLGGFLIGPHGLGWIGAGNTTIPELGQLGLLYLMFVAGVELDLALLRVHRRAALTFAAATFTFPLVLGIAVGLGLGWSTASAVLLGSLVASYTLVLYPAARAARLSADPAVASAVGATVLTDTAALILLAVVAGSEVGSGSTPELVLQIGLGLAVLLAFSFLLLPRLARLAFRYLGSDRTVRYVLAVASFLAAATLAEVFGIEGIVGAFFAGLALNRLVPNEGPLMERIDFFGTAVFVPIFLVSVGLLLDPAVMVERETLKLAALFIAACIGGKAAAAWLTKRLMGYSREQGMLVFALSTPQAAATLAATIVGFNIGLFSESVVNAVLVLILVSIVVATLVLERNKGRVPPPVRGERRLGGRVLVALEEPAQAGAAFTVAARLAAPDGGVVHGVLACTPSAVPRDEAVLERLGAAAVEAGVDTEPRLIVDSSPAEGVVNAAIAQEASFVLVGEAGRSGASAFGTWGESVAGAAPAPVAILRGQGERLTGVRLVRSDGAADVVADTSVLAAEVAVRLGGTDVQVRESSLGAAIAALEPGELAVAAVASWELLADLPAPRDGAAVLLVLEPAVPLAAGADAAGSAEAPG